MLNAGNIAKAALEINDCFQSAQRAAEQYLKAAEQGDVDAMYQLGECYEDGFGVEEDEEEAIKWYRKAAEQGNDDAIDKLKELGENDE